MDSTTNAPYLLSKLRNCARIGHGPVIGASGARIIVTLLNALETRGLTRGIAAICMSGGEGTAIATERPFFFWG